MLLGLGGDAAQVFTGSAAVLDDVEEGLIESFNHLRKMVFHYCYEVTADVDLGVYVLSSKR